MANPTEFKIKDKKWRVVRDENNRVIDIQVALSKAEYIEIKRKLFDPESKFENTSSLDLLKNGFAKSRAEASLELYEQKSQQHSLAPEANTSELLLLEFLDKLEDFSTHSLNELDLLINSAYVNPQQKLNDLQNKMKHYQTHLLESNELESWVEENSSQLSAHQNEFIQQDISKLKGTLLSQLKIFQSQLKQLEGDAQLDQKLELLLSAQDKSKIASLGGFIGKQTQAVCNVAIETSITLKKRYLKDVYYQKNDVTAAFIEANAKLRLKNTALYGAEFTDTKLENIEQTIPENGYLSVLPYLSGHTGADLDKIICLISEIPLSERNISSPPKTWGGWIGHYSSRALNFTNLYVFAPVAEVIITPLHFISVAVLTAFRGVPLLRASVDGIAQRLNKLHEDFSPVSAAKRIWNAQYQRLNKEDLDHQKLIEAYQDDGSVLVNFFKIFTPENIFKGVNYVSNVISNRLNQWYQSVVNFKMSDLFKSTPTPQEVFNDYIKNYQMLEPILKDLKKTAMESEKKLGPSDKFPGITRQRVNKINSPTRIFCEMIYIFDEHIVNHLAETRPGPATFFFMVSLATFGSSIAPAGALAWMHGVPNYMQLVPTKISQYFTGYQGPLGSPNGALAAVLQFKLCTAGTSILARSFDKNNTILETMAANPEEIIIGLAAFIGIGYAVGYMPSIPTIPSHIPGSSVLNVYSEFFNTISHESAVTRLGIKPFIFMEDFLIGVKMCFLLESLLSNGRQGKDGDDIIQIVGQLRSKKILQELSEKGCQDKIKEALIQCNNPHFSADDPILIHKLYHLVKETQQQAPAMKDKLETTMQQTKNEIKQWKEMIDHAADQPTLGSTFEQLEQAVKMLSDPYTPMTFPAHSRKDAIQFYNHLSRLFDTYNEEIKQGLHIGHRPISKQEFLQTFRNRYIDRGEYNIARLVSFWPFYPIRFLWREAKLAFNPTPYTIDSVKASREMDETLRLQGLGAFVRSPGYAFANLFNKVIKASIGFFPTVGIVGQELFKNGREGILNLFRDKDKQAPIEFDTMSYRLQALGRSLNPIAVQNSLSAVNQYMSPEFKEKAPLSVVNLRARAGEVAANVDNYDDIQAMGKRVLERFSANHTNQTMYKAKFEKPPAKARPSEDSFFDKPNRPTDTVKIISQPTHPLDFAAMPMMTPVNNMKPVSPEQKIVSICEETLEDLEIIISEQTAAANKLPSVRARLEKAQKDALKIETTPLTRGYIYSFFEYTSHALQKCAQHLYAQSQWVPKNKQEAKDLGIEMQERTLSYENKPVIQNKEQQETIFQKFLDVCEDGLNQLKRSLCAAKTQLFKQNIRLNSSHCSVMSEKNLNSIRDIFSKAAEQIKQYMTAVQLPENIIPKCKAVLQKAQNDINKIEMTTDVKNRISAFFEKIFKALELCSKNLGLHTSKSSQEVGIELIELKSNTLNKSSEKAAKEVLGEPVKTEEKKSVKDARSAFQAFIQLLTDGLTELQTAIYPEMKENNSHRRSMQ